MSRKIALASFPRSGNTWIRYLLKYYTGIEPTTIYGGGPDHDKTPFIKTHELDSYNYRKAIHLIRDPFDCIDSQWHYVNTKNGKLDKIQIQNKISDQFLNRSIREWKYHALHWFNCDILTILIKYEDLVENTTIQLLKIIEFSFPEHKIDLGKIQYAVQSCKLEKLRNLWSNDRISDESQAVGMKSEEFFRSGKVGSGGKHFIISQQQRIIDELGEYEHVAEIYSSYFERNPNDKEARALANLDPNGKVDLRGIVGRFTATCVHCKSTLYVDGFGLWVCPVCKNSFTVSK